MAGAAFIPAEANRGWRPGHLRDEPRMESQNHGSLLPSQTVSPSATEELHSCAPQIMQLLICEKGAKFTGDIFPF